MKRFVGAAVLLGVACTAHVIVRLRITPVQPVETSLSQEGNPPEETLLALAPPGFSHEDLGRPVDATFKPVGGPLTDRGDRHEHRRLAIREQRSFTVDDARLLDANAAAWNVPEGRNVAVYRAIDLTEVHEVDDDDEDGLRAAPAGAVWYVWRVFYGRSYDAILSADQGTFGPETRTTFANAAGTVRDFASAHGLAFSEVTRGLTPSGDAVFARTPDEIAAAFHPSGEPVPVLVEYRRLPNAQTAARAIDWSPRVVAMPPPAHPGFLQGSVVDKSTHQPLGSVTVTVTSALLAGPRSVVTDLKGNYVITGLAPGAYRIRFLYQDDSVEATADGNVAVEQGQFTTVNVKLDRGT